MLEVLVLSAIILLICLILFSVNVLLKKNGKFPNMHVGSNPALRKKGIKCARTQDFEAGIQKNLFERMQKEA
ncbi:MAG: hypothetical protein LBG96_03070 [Tannerella sp.]|jgi:hypothetical protein|nr:hypothetical protein [Tannerella sp.]